MPDLEEVKCFSINGADHLEAVLGIQLQVILKPDEQDKAAQLE